MRGLKILLTVAFLILSVCVNAAPIQVIETTLSDNGLTQFMAAQLIDRPEIHHGASTAITHRPSHTCRKPFERTHIHDHHPQRLGHHPSPVASAVWGLLHIIRNTLANQVNRHEVHAKILHLKSIIESHPLQLEFIKSNEEKANDMDKMHLAGLLAKIQEMETQYGALLAQDPFLAANHAALQGEARLVQLKIAGSGQRLAQAIKTANDQHDKAVRMLAILEKHHSINSA